VTKATALVQPHRRPPPAGGRSRVIGELPQLIRGRPQIVRGRPQVIRGRPRAIRGRPQVIRGRPRAIRGRPRVIWGRPPMVWGRPRIIQNRLLMHHPRPQPPKRHAFEASYGPFQNRGSPPIDPRGAPRVGSRPHRPRQRRRLRSGSDRGKAAAGRRTPRRCRAGRALGEREAVTIAQPFMAGANDQQMKSPARDGRKMGWPCASTFRPYQDLGK